MTDVWTDAFYETPDEGHYRVYLEARPTKPTEGEPLHGFVATVRLATLPDGSPWDAEADDKLPRELIHRSEHGSMVAAIKAAQRAADRARDLRFLPEPE